MTLSAEPTERFVTYLSYDGYCKMLEAMAERRLRITYDRGVLEIVSPTPEHERLKSQLGVVLDTLFRELDIEFLKGGSTPFKSRLKEKGFEPDECYWLDDFEKVEDVEDYDPETGLPPHLAIEVDVTSSSLDRVGIYAAFGVGELWRWEQDGRLRLYELRDGAYHPIERSRWLPQVPLEELQRFGELGRELITSKLVREVRAWLQTF